MSINPQKLHKIWYASMNNAEVPDLKNKLESLTCSYPLYDENLKAISPMLMFGLKQGFISQDQVANAIAEKDRLTQINLVSDLIAEKCWKPFTTKISSIMCEHETKIRQLIINALKGLPETQNRIAEEYDNILKNRAEISTLSLSINSNGDFGDWHLNSFAARITFSDAYITEFDVSKLNFDQRQLSVVCKIIQIIMPFQFECSTLDLNNYSNEWLYGEVFSSDDVNRIGQYIHDSNGSYELDDLCNELNIDEETRTTIDDYGVDGIYDYWLMDKLSDRINAFYKDPDIDIEKSLAKLAVKFADLTPLLSVYEYFSKQIKPITFPFDSGSDIDVSEQLIYSFGMQEEQACIHEAGERYFNSGESAAMNIRFEDENIYEFFENFAITNCLVSLIMALLQLRE